MTDENVVESLSETVSFKLSTSLNEEIEAELDAEGGLCSKSEWVREACRERLDEAQAPAEPVSE